MVNKKKKKQKQDQFQDFVDIVNASNDTITFLNKMILGGLDPKQSVSRNIEMKNSKRELQRQLENMKRSYKNWKDQNKRMINYLDSLEKMFFLVFKGKNLTRLNQNNLIHFLWYFSKNMKLKKDMITNTRVNFEDNDQKIAFLKSIFNQNKRQFEENVQNTNNNHLLQDTKIYYSRRDPSNVHNYLIYFYKDLFREELECNKIIFCNDKTTWNCLKSNNLYFY